MPETTQRLPAKIDREIKPNKIANSFKNFLSNALEVLLLHHSVHTLNLWVSVVIIQLHNRESSEWLLVSPRSCRLKWRREKELKTKETREKDKYKR